MTFFLLLLTLSFSSFAQFDSCERADIKKIIGASGSCSSILIPQKVPALQSTCSATLMETFSCNLFFFNQGEQALASLRCVDKEGKDRILPQSMQVEVSSVRVALLVTDEKGSEQVLADERKLISVSNQRVALSFYDAQGVKEDAQFYLNQPSGVVELTNVICK